MRKAMYGYDEEAGGYAGAVIDEHDIVLTVGIMETEEKNIDWLKYVITNECWLDDSEPPDMFDTIN